MVNTYLSMRRLLILFVLLLACGDGRLSPQGGTITSVQGGSGMTGGGTGGAVTLNVVPTTGGGLTVGTDSIGITPCAVGEVRQWDGTSWSCGVGGITMSAAANVIPRSDGTNLVASGLTDDGFTVGVARDIFVTGNIETTGDATIQGDLSTNGDVAMCTAGVHVCALGEILGTTASWSDNVYIGSDPSNAHAVVGTVNFNATAGTNGQILQIVGGMPVWGAPSSAGINTFSTANAIPVGNGTGLIASGLTDDGTTIKASRKVAVSGALLVNAINANTPTFESGLPASAVVTQGDGNYGLAVVRATNNVSGSYLTLMHTRSTDPAGKVALQSGDVIGAISFQAPSDTSSISRGAQIQARVDGAVSSGTIPTTIEFMTGTGSPATRLSINSGGTTSVLAGLSLTGTLTANATAGTNGDVLTIVGGLPKWQSLATSGIVTGTLTSGRSVRATGTGTVGAGAFTDDGTNATIGGALTVTGTLTASNSLIGNGSGAVTGYFTMGTAYGETNGFACNRTTNADATCHFNKVSYNNLSSVTRNLQINDGLGSALGIHSIAYFNGTDHSTTLYGVLDVNNDLVKLGSTIDGGVYFTGGPTGANSINFEYGTAAVATGYINRVANAGATGTFRNLVIADGKTNAIATFTGQTKRVDFAGLAAVGTLGPYMTTDSTLNFAIGSTGTVTGYINYYGYNNGWTVNRNLVIADGKANPIATFTGQTRTTVLSSGTTTAPAALTGSVLTLEQADATDLNLTLRGTGNKYIAFAHNGATGRDGYVWYSTSRNMLFGVAGQTYMMIDASSGIKMGDVGGVVINNNSDVLTIGNTGTGQTASTSLIKSTHTGSFNTTAGNITYYGLNIAVSATESAGTNTLTGVAARFSATNGDDPIGLWVDDGRTQFDDLVTVTNTSTYDASAGDITAYGAKIIANPTCTNVGPFQCNSRALWISTAPVGASSTFALWVDSGSAMFKGGTRVEGGLTVFDGTIFNGAGTTTDIATNVELGASTGNTVSFNGKIDTKVYYTGTAPTLSSCGTSPTIVGNNERGTVTIGTGTATTCTITFASGQWDTNPPACVLTSQTSTRVDLYFSAKSISSMTVANAASANMAGAKFDYHCDGIL